MTAAELEGTDQATGQPERACSANYQFTATAHANALLACMRTLRENAQQLCDVTLCVAEYEFPAHRLVLAASSPYFSAMFTNSHHRESSLSRVPLSGVEPAALGSLIEFAYSSHLSINAENVQALLIAGNLLQMSAVVEACCQFLVEQVDVENCLGIAAFAEMLSCSQLYQSSWRFALENFHDVWRAEEFLATPTPLLQELLKSEHLHVLCEEEVLACALRWYSHDKASRRQSLKALLKHVKLPLVPWTAISDTLLADPVLSADPDIQLLTIAARTFQTSPLLAQQQQQLERNADSAQFLPRKSVGQSQFLYVVGGETTPGRSTVGSVERYSPSKGSWNALASMATGRRGVGVAFLNGLLYVVGGSDGVQALRLVECYDPHSNTWLPVPALTQERSSVATASLEGKLYAIGGYDGITSCLKTVECFESGANSWSSLPAMNVSRSMHDAVVLGARIFVVGGYDGSADLTSCEVYAPGAQRWDVLAAMQSPRCMASAGVLGEQLYVVGGCDCSQQSLCSVELYHAEKEEWQLVAEMNEPRSGHGVGVVGRKLYALGGYGGSATGYSSSIECFDPETNVWSVVGSMNAERRRFGCCS